MRSVIENKYLPIFILILSCVLTTSLLGQTRNQIEDSDLEYVIHQFYNKGWSA